MVLLATGYLPSLGYLAPLGALSPDGMPLHSGGISTTRPGLDYLGLEFQRSFASHTLRGEARDAAYVIPRSPPTSANSTKVLPLLEPDDDQGVAPCCPPLTERPMTAEKGPVAERAARMFKALGDPVRLGTLCGDAAQNADGPVPNR